MKANMKININRNDIMYIMKLVIICSMILPVLSFMKEKLCIHCKYFIGNDKFGKCAMFPKIENKINYLISGVQENEYNACSVARLHDDMCGEYGLFFKKKHISKYKKDRENKEKIDFEIDYKYEN